MDRLIDKRSSSYHEMADVCLKTVGTEKKLFNTSPGMINEIIIIRAGTIFRYSLESLH